MCLLIIDKPVFLKGKRYKFFVLNSIAKLFLLHFSAGNFVFSFGRFWLIFPKTRQYSTQISESMFEVSTLIQFEMSKSELNFQEFT